jgi:5-methylcytosine-specific restriction endonuclease McrA
VNTAAASAARLLIDAVGLRPHITAEAARRLAEDADLQLIIKQDGQIVGISEPTATIPAKVRAATTARDQGCRFPGCRMPATLTDLHHVVPRSEGGPTLISNLVCLCRRHHVAVHEGGWNLHLHHNGAVTIRRGRVVHTSDPP